MDDISMNDNSDKQRFEITKDGKLAAFAEYDKQPDALLLKHTEVMPQFEGQGMGSKIASYALGEVRKRGLHAVPECSFIAGYIRKHPEYLDLVTQDNRVAYKL